ncbi:MAG TPA: choice-of-anchor Q domain-containing protein, partial [Rhizomicrobium sp.]|nr:choice-of-anchor Q domain-containing protein [Rhizomicrobium sp.]
NITLTAPISIDVDTTIDAQGHAVTLSGNQQMLVFNVAAGVNFTSLGLTITSGMNTNGGALYVNANATVLLTNCTLAGNSAIGPNGVAGASGANSASGDGGSGQSGTAGSPGFGGAIFNLGNLALLNCTLVTNTATGGIGGGGGNGGNGGGQLAHGGNGGNGGAGAVALGGAIYHVGGALLVSNCTFSGNSAIGGSGGAGGTNGTGFTPGLAGSGGPGASGSGAGLYSNQTNTVLNCTFSDNAAQGGNSAAGGTASNGTGITGAPGADSSGGGIYLAGRGMVVNCTFFNDKATGGGGGNGGNGAGQLSQGGNGGNGGNGAGGGLYNTGFCGVTNCTFSKGSAVGGTNGLAGSGTFPGSTGHLGQARGGNIANGAGTFWLKNSILATNLSGGNGYGPISAAGNNLSTDASIALGTNSFANTDPKLGALTNNGGPTRTMALLTTNTPGIAANSPALNAGDDTGCPATDQRGVSRPQPVGGHCDIGAYEATILPAIITPPQNQSQTNGGTVTFFVSAAGAPILKYRWRFNGTNISGAVSSNYTIAQITITNAGNYDVTVTNSFGSVTSSVATLSVGPNITIQPTNQEVAAGGDTTFMV